MSDRSVVFVVPAFNEGEVVSETISPIVAAGHVVICVDDASQDETAKKASEAGALVIRHLINAGQGASLQTGFEFILQNKIDFANIKYIATFDADGQHSLSDLENFLQKFDVNPDLEIVLGSRFLASKFKGSRAKFYILKIMASLAEFTIGVKVTDRHNGFRVIRKDILENFNLKSPGFEHADEFLHILSKNRLNYAEVSTDINYTKYSLKKGQPIINGFKMLFDRFMNGWR